MPDQVYVSDVDGLISLDPDNIYAKGRQTSQLLSIILLHILRGPGTFLKLIFPIKFHFNLLFVLSIYSSHHSHHISKNIINSFMGLSQSCTLQINGNHSTVWVIRYLYDTHTCQYVIGYEYHQLQLHILGSCQQDIIIPIFEQRYT